MKSSNKQKAKNRTKEWFRSVVRHGKRDSRNELTDSVAKEYDEAVIARKLSRIV